MREQAKRAISKYVGMFYSRLRKRVGPRLPVARRSWQLSVGLSGQDGRSQIERENNQERQRAEAKEPDEVGLSSREPLVGTMIVYRSSAARVARIIRVGKPLMIVGELPVLVPGAVAPWSKSSWSSFEILTEKPCVFIYELQPLPPSHNLPKPHPQARRLHSKPSRFGPHR